MMKLVSMKRDMKRRKMVEELGTDKPSKSASAVLFGCGAWLACMLSFAGVAHGQPAIDRSAERALAWHDSNRHKADVISTVLVAAAVATPCIGQRTVDKAWTCWSNEGIRVGIAIGAAELVKHFIHRTRPDGSDRKSFYSEHTTIACAATLHTKAWAFCPAVGYGRVAANKHWLSDAGTGAAVGGLLAFTIK